MSTKTTFKRVALVAVASLGLGVLASVPSNAAPTIAYGVIADSAAGQAIVGGQATVAITLDSGTVTNVAVTGVGSVLAQSTQTDTVTVVGDVTKGSWSDSTTVSNVKGVQTITLGSSVAGVTTISATPLSATGVPGTAVTKTITWVTATTTGTYDHAHAYISATDLNARFGQVDSTTAQLTFASTFSATPVATIAVTQFNSLDTTTVTTLPTANTTAVVATITGAGAIGTSSSNAGASVTIAAKGAPEQFLKIFPDGRNGAATITITVNGVALPTKTVNFYGSAKSYAMSTTTGETLSKKQIAIAAAASGADAESATVTIKELDAIGTIMGTTATTHVTSDTATIATAIISSGVVYIYGVGLGTTNINVCNTASCTSATIKLVIPITVVEKTAASYVLAFDKATYAPGEKVTWTLTATTKTGKTIADGTRAVLGTTTTNVSIPVGTLPGASAKFVSGVATDFFYAPSTTGDVEVTTVEGAAIDAVIASASYTAAKKANLFSVTNAAADAATDAANEATDAANAATDAALAAADAADAATAAAEDASAAVATLAKSVNTALANLKKQITALTALVNKLLKK